MHNCIYVHVNCTRMLWSCPEPEFTAGAFTKGRVQPFAYRILHTKYVKIAQTFFSQKNLNQGVLNTSEPDIQVFYHRTCDPTLWLNSRQIFFRLTRLVFTKKYSYCTHHSLILARKMSRTPSSSCNFFISNDFSQLLLDHKGGPRKLGLY